MSNFELSGSTASLQPFDQRWIDFLMGRDHVGRPVYSATKSATFQMDACTTAQYQQWADLHGTSLTRIQMLNLVGTSLIEYSGSNGNIFLEVTQRPSFQDIHTEPWQVTISGLTP